MLQKPRVYLDNNATTRVSEAAAGEMQKFQTIYYGNPSSLHHFAIEILPELRKAMDNIYRLLNARAEDDIIITSGATEANNHILKSIFWEKINNKKNHIITTNVEHPSVYNVLKYLETLGATVTYLPVDKKGLLKPEQVKAAITEKTILVSIMLANNEIGTIFPLKEISQIVHSYEGVLFHTDATQALGKIAVDVRELNPDFLSFSGHKFHGPKGVGGLFIHRGKKLTPFLHGGEQMHNLRAGTLNVPGIIGMGIAAEEALEAIAIEATAVKKLRDKLENYILKNIKDTFLNGDNKLRTPNTTNISFKDIEGEAMLWDLDQHGIAASTGSACASEDLETSRVLRAIGIDKALSHAAIRFSLSKHTTVEEIDYVIKVLPEIVKRLRNISSGE